MDHQTAIPGVNIPPRIAAIPLLLQDGYSTKDIAEIQGISRRQVYNRIAKIPRDLDLTSKKRVKLAVKAVETIVQGGLVGQMDKVAGAHVLQAAGMVLDRHQPLKSQDQASNVSYTNVNINIFK